MISLTALVFTVSACNKEGDQPSSVRDETKKTLSASKDPFEPTRVKIVETIKTYIGDRVDPLKPEDYKKIAEKISKVTGVEDAGYAGDPLGTIYIKIKDGGFMLWRHIRNDFKGEGMLPEEADFKNLFHPEWNKGWKVQELGEINEDRSQYYVSYEEPAITRVQFLIPPRQPDHLSLGRPMGETNRFATRFPVATGKPDPNFSADDSVSCPEEGKIAIVDFVWTEAHKDAPGFYDSQFMVDGVPFYDRIKMMGEAAGFKVDLFKDAEINLGNFKKLEDYTIVILIGHGAKPWPKATERLGKMFPSISTPEKYEPGKISNVGITYEDAWKKGYILRSIDKEVLWTPLLFKDFYRPRTEQLFMLNQCFAMLPFWVGFFKDEKGNWSWRSDMAGDVYNFGEGLMASGVKVVFGYIYYAKPEAIVINTMHFFRRLFGGYYIKDAPPSPHIFWPTCMSAQTYFRMPGTPRLPIYGNKYYGKSMYTMYAVDDPKFFRKVCSPANKHAYLQSFMLRVGTPATALLSCWDRYWSKGEKVSGLKDPLCGQGDFPTTGQETHNAACAVKIARKVTNAMLKK